MKKISKKEDLNIDQLSLKDTLLQVVFLINNNRFESALEIVKINEIPISLLSQNESIGCLEDFMEFVKNKF